MLQIARDELIDYIKTNQDKLYKISYTYTKNQDMALDVVQEAITKALENIHKLKNVEYVKTWFYRILINEALQNIKKNKKILETEYVESNQGSKHDQEILIQNLDIYEKIQNLNDKLKTVIILRYFEDLKIEEIAVITKTNVNTVKSRLYKAIKELKTECAKESKAFEEHVYKVV